MGLGKSKFTAPGDFEEGLKRDGWEKRGAGGYAPATGSSQESILHRHPLSFSLPLLHCWLGWSFLHWIPGEIYISEEEFEGISISVSGWES